MKPHENRKHFKSKKFRNGEILGMVNDTFQYCVSIRMLFFLQIPTHSNRGVYYIAQAS